MKNAIPDIFSYINYREYLRDIYNTLKMRNKKYSCRFISSHVGSSSPSWFTDITSCRINLTESYFHRLCEFLGLTCSEKSYFRLLVDYNQTSSPVRRKECLDTILSTRSFKIDLITRHKFEYFSRWYIPVIREFLLVHPAKMEDYKSIAQKLIPSITPREAKSALEILSSLDLIKADKSGFLRPTETVIKKDRSEKSAHIPAYHQENMKLAIEAIDRFPAERRDVSSITFYLTSERMQEARDEIKNLRKILLRLSQVSGPGGQIFQCNIQLYPVTK
jgi:uncharacterized protein (TIGR02147 family)